MATAILCVKFICDQINARYAYDEDLNVLENYISNGTCSNMSIELNCYLFQNISEVCSIVKDKACSDSRDILGDGLKVFLSMISCFGMACYTFYNHKDPSLNLSDFLEEHELVLLNRYNIPSDTGIETARNNIKLLMETRKYRDILLQTSWEMIRSYLEPLDVKKINQKAKDEARRELIGIDKWDSSQIMEKTQLDAQEAELLGDYFEGLTETKNRIDQDEKKINVETAVQETQEITKIIQKNAIDYYPTLLSRIHRAQVLDEKSTLYCASAENQLLKNYQAENNISGIPQIQLAQKKLATAKGACIMAKAFKSKISFFVKNSLEHSNELNDVLNKSSEVDKNISALKILDFLM
jgi:hypothetical protein